MPDCEREIEIDAPVDAVLAYVSSPENLRQFIPGVRDADRIWNGGVDIIAEPGERRVEADLQRDTPRHRVSWSVEGPGGYHGHLNVLPADRGSLVRASVHSDRHSESDLGPAMDGILQKLAKAIAQET